MKRIFFHRLVLSFLVILIMVFLSWQGWLKYPQNLLLGMISPVQEKVYGLSAKIYEMIDFGLSLGQLKREKDGLEKENRRLKAELAHSQEIFRENKYLRTQLGVKQINENPLIMAKIIGRIDTGNRKCLLINRGKEESVEQFDTVLAAGNVLLGRVVEVEESFSKVELIGDPNSRINAIISESDIDGIVKVSEDGELIVDFLPSDKIIEKNSSVVTSGSAGFFPTGLLIGEITKVLSSEVQSSQKAKLRPAIELNKLNEVFVMSLR